MTCPFCQHRASRVVDSRSLGEAIRRRRECEGCARRFSTLERLDRRMPQVLKKDGTRQAFDLHKVRRGFALSCRKRPVDNQAIDDALGRIEARIYGSAQADITSEQVGRHVLEELRGLDGVAFVRFASVYLEFDDPEQFLGLVERSLGGVE
ncbi:MAG TPA: transcriptional regulator NrdR [Myxococcota bacterium]|nr:transcriptional regulator NrdR [Myxococcota bacterium]